ncbi:MAG: polyprenyl synthetase family protein [Methanotrichaceae archaeon]|nr:polyprenyl synthetase family protein [Methanotrichaceae archaeon]
MIHDEMLDRFGDIIESDLRNVFALHKESGKKYHSLIGQVYEYLEEFVLRRGRRLASCSTLIAYEGYHGDIDSKIVRVCSGIELYRHAILIHDDIVDRETLRRGGETLHKVMGPDNEQIGLGSAIFAANILHSMSLLAVLDSNYEPQKTNEIVDLLAGGYTDVNESQILDLLFEYKELSVKEWKVMASKRAASLFRAAILAGAILGSAEERDKVLLEKAAMHIGFAFDIQDDIIDTFATRDQYGRDPCGDMSRGKKPLHIAIALNKDKRLASLMQQKRNLTTEEVLFVQDLIRKCGALDEAKAISRNHAKEAIRLISETKMIEENKAFFISLIKYVDESLEWYK